MRIYTSEGSLVVNDANWRVVSLETAEFLLRALQRTEGGDHAVSYWPHSAVLLRFEINNGALDDHRYARLADDGDGTKCSKTHSVIC